MGCAATPVPTTAGVITSLSPPIFWDLNANTNGHPFTPIPGLAVGDVICVDSNGNIISSFSCGVDAQFLIDGVPVTSPFPICPINEGISAELAQFLVNTHLINPNVTITATDNGTNIQVIVTTSNGFHTTASVQVTFSGMPMIIAETTFVCTPIRNRRRRNAGASLPSPSQICVKSDPSNPNCPPSNVQFKNNGVVYELIGKDENGNCCYRIKR